MTLSAVAALCALVALCATPAAAGSIGDVLAGVSELDGLQGVRDTVGGTKAVVLVFYAPWCPHSNALVSTLREVVEVVRGSPSARDSVALAKVDGNFHAVPALHYQVERFPTVLIFNKGEAEPAERLEGFLSAPSLLHTMQQNMPDVEFAAGANGRGAQIPIAVLKPETLKAAVEYKDRAVLVQFITRSSEAARDFAETYAAVAQAFAKEANVLTTVFDLDSSADVRRQYGLTAEGAPHLILFRGDLTRPLHFKTEGNGLPAAADLVAFVNDHTGTARGVDGGLSKKAALIPVRIPPNFLPSHPLSPPLPPCTQRQEINDAVAGNLDEAGIAKGLAAVDAYLKVHPDSHDATLYQRLLEKISHKGGTWAATEIGRLESMIQKGLVWTWRWHVRNAKYVHTSPHRSLRRRSTCSRNDSTSFALLGSFAASETTRFVPL